MKKTVYNIGYKKYATCVDNFKEYNIWRSILARCYVENNKDFKRYGAIGITVDERWHCFDNFLEDIRTIKGYNDTLFYEGRIQLDKDISGKKIYSKDSCEFVSIEKNCRNRKNNLKFYVIYPNMDVEFFSDTQSFIEKSNIKFLQGTISNCVYKKFNKYKNHYFISVEEYNNNTLKEILKNRNTQRERIKYPILANNKENNFTIKNSEELKLFAKNNDLSTRKIRDYIQGRVKSFKDWEFELLRED